MNNDTKQLLSNHLKEAMNQEDLNTRAAAKCLNLNPCYISMAQNPKSWDAMGKASWERLQEWSGTREKLSSFVIPEGEPIWQPKEKPVEPRKKPEKKPQKQEEVKTALVPKPIDLNIPPVIKEKIKEVDKQIDELLNQKEEKISYAAETARLKVALDIEINLVINGHKISLN